MVGEHDVIDKVERVGVIKLLGLLLELLVEGKEERVARAQAVKDVSLAVAEGISKQL